MRVGSVSLVDGTGGGCGKGWDKMRWYGVWDGADNMVRVGGVGGKVGWVLVEV